MYDHMILCPIHMSGGSSVRYTHTALHMSGGSSEVYIHIKPYPYVRRILSEVYTYSPTHTSGGSSLRYRHTALPTCPQDSLRYTHTALPTCPEHPLRYTLYPYVRSILSKVCTYYSPTHIESGWVIIKL